MPSALPSIPAPHYFYRNAGHSALDYVRPVLGSFNLVDADKAHIYPKHQHLNYQLIFARRGTYRCHLNDTPLVLRSRDVLFVKRGDWHEDICGPGLIYLAINFDLTGNGSARAEDIVLNPDVTPDQQVIRGPNQILWKVLNRMQDESQRDDHFVPYFENALLLEMFWSVVRALPREHLSPIFLQRSAAQAFSERVRRVFDHHVSENLSTDTIASLLGMSVRNLTKRCQEVVGRPPGRAFAAYKMEYAARLLRQSEFPIKEISNRLGFQNQYHFSRVFRRYLSMSPSAFRSVPK